MFLWLLPLPGLLELVPQPLYPVMVAGSHLTAAERGREDVKTKTPRMRVFTENITDAPGVNSNQRVDPGAFFSSLPNTFK